MEIDKGLKEWHPMFCAALKEYFKDYDELSIIPEYNISKNPLRIDVLIKNSDDKIENEIGRFFKNINIIEYKSPQDTIVIDDYYKTLAYAYLYKSLREDDQNKDFIDINKFTLSIFGSKKPQKLLKYLEETEKLKVTEVSPGIYYIDGGTIPIQIVNFSKLDKLEEEYVLMLFSNDKNSFKLATEELLKNDDLLYRNELIGTAYAKDGEIFMEVVKTMLADMERYKQENIISMIKNTFDEDIIKKCFINDILEKEKLKIIKEKDNEKEKKIIDIVIEKEKEKADIIKEKDNENAKNLQDTIIKVIKTKFKSIPKQRVNQIRKQKDISVLSGMLVALMNCNTLDEFNKLL